jgi:hypothetical protein
MNRVYVYNSLLDYQQGINSYELILPYKCNTLAMLLRKIFENERIEMSVCITKNNYFIPLSEYSKILENWIYNIKIPKDNGELIAYVK